MADRAHGTPSGGAECEECGASGAQPMRVELSDETAKTFDLCEDCLDEFRAADLIDEVRSAGEKRCVQ